MKFLKWIVLAVIIVIIVVAAGIFIGLDSIVRRTVESQATASLNLTTTLGGANVSILGGSVSLSDLQIASPQGFQADHMFGLGGVKVGVTYGKLRDNPIVIDQITIDNPKLVVEQSGGKFNFQAVMDQQSKTPTDTKGQQTEPLKLIIHQLNLNNAEVVLRPGIPGLNNEITVPVPSLQLTDIGSGEGNKNGAAIKDVVMTVVTALVQKASDAGGLPGDVQKILNGNISQIRDQLQTQVNKIGEEVTKKIPGDVGKQVQKGIGDLLNGNKKDDQKQK